MFFANFIFQAHSSVLFGYCLPAPNQLKHKTLSNGLIDFIVGMADKNQLPREEYIICPIL